jgi:flavin reductase (DIM6/NTAB) family NADH-FMN oxidoreductase RutF
MASSDAAGCEPYDCLVVESNHFRSTTEPIVSAPSDRAMMERMDTHPRLDPVADRIAFIDAMSRAVTGVTVVATDGEAGQFGQTVSAMSSVSADPPLLLVCINRKSPICQAIEQHGVFSVNVLRADQQRVAQVFAGRPRSGLPYDFTSAVWETAVTGSPLLVGAVARFDCKLHDTHLAGTHFIYVGRVVDSTSEPSAALVYAQRTYGEPLLFPHHHEWRPVPAGFVGDEPDKESEDLWDTEQ